MNLKKIANATENVWRNIDGVLKALQIIAIVFGATWVVSAFYVKEIYWPTRHPGFISVKTEISYGESSNSLVPVRIRAFATNSSKRRVYISNGLVHIAGLSVAENTTDLASWPGSELEKLFEDLNSNDVSNSKYTILKRNPEILGYASLFSQTTILYPEESIEQEHTFFVSCSKQFNAVELKIRVPFGQDNSVKGSWRTPENGKVEPVYSNADTNIITHNRQVVLNQKWCEST